jgi:lipoprotein-releasing system permease protein
MFTIVGIYNTGFGELDKSLVICDLKHIQKLNNWQSDEVGGAEILLDDFSQIPSAVSRIDEAVDYNCTAYSIIDRHKFIFEWITLINQNVFILIALVIIIAALSLISTQLTFILEHIPTIGILKTLGCTSFVIGNIFVFVSIKVLSIGLLFGNAAGLLLCFLQSKWQFVTLNAENYYVDFVPVNVRLWHVLAINAGAVVISVLVLVVPAYFVSQKVKTTDALTME